jgi:putative transposase
VNKKIDMKFYQEKIYHIYNQGNNQQKIFFEKKNYLFFLNKMRTHLCGHCDILSWCLMPNHFHWMIQIHPEYEENLEKHLADTNAPIVDPLNRSISILLSSYTKAINRMYGRSGSLFRGRTKSIDLSPDDRTDNQHPLICLLYIHQNPLKAGLVNKLEDWEFSSYMDYAGLREGTICSINQTQILLDLPSNHQEFTKLSYQTIPEHLLSRYPRLPSAVLG